MSCKMKKNFSFIVFLLFCSIHYGQTDSVISISSVKEKLFRYQNDSFLSVTVDNSLIRKNHNYSTSNDILLKFTETGFDTLVGFADLGESEYKQGYISPKTDDILISYLKNRNSIYAEEDEWEDVMRKEYSYFNSIDYLGSGVFTICTGHYEYTGGAHGYGKAYYVFFDAEINKSFNYQEVFKKGIDDFVYEQVKKEITYNGLIGGYTEQQADSLTEGQRFLKGDQYVFGKSYFSVVSQSYETLYGVFYGGYPGFNVDIHYNDLKKYIIKETPVWRLYEAARIHSASKKR